jgi:hypothetical protein
MADPRYQYRNTGPVLTRSNQCQYLMRKPILLNQVGSCVNQVHLRFVM